MWSKLRKCQGRLILSKFSWDCIVNAFQALKHYWMQNLKQSAGKTVIKLVETSFRARKLNRNSSIILIMQLSNLIHGLLCKAFVCFPHYASFFLKKKERNLSRKENLKSSIMFFEVW